jgi:uncharacterized protein with PIN domain
MKIVNTDSAKRPAFEAAERHGFEAKRTLNKEDIFRYTCADARIYSLLYKKCLKYDDFPTICNTFITSLFQQLLLY